MADEYDSPSFYKASYCFDLSFMVVYNYDADLRGVRHLRP